MKRALPSYEDLFEEGEIIEEERAVLNKNVKLILKEFESSDEELEMGLKAVLPVGKFNEKFREGDVPESGEQYLCTVRSQRKKLENIVSVSFEDGTGGVELDVLIKNVEEIEVDKKWADEYAECLKKSEGEFHAQLDEILEEFFIDFSNLTPSEWHKKIYETGEIEANMNVLRAIKDSQEICGKLLNLHKRWLNGESENQLNLDSIEILNKTATWLQALIMCRDSRLTSPEVANLRQLAVTLMAHGDRIEMMEVILAIVKKYGQLDLIKYK